MPSEAKGWLAGAGITLVLSVLADAPWLLLVSLVLLVIGIASWAPRPPVPPEPRQVSSPSAAASWEPPSRETFRYPRSRTGFTCNDDGTLLRPDTFGILRCHRCGQGYEARPLVVDRARGAERPSATHRGPTLEPRDSGETCEQCGRRTVAIETSQSRTVEETATLVLRCTTCQHTWRQYR